MNGDQILKKQEPNNKSRFKFEIFYIGGETSNWYWKIYKVLVEESAIKVQDKPLPKSSNRIPDCKKNFVNELEQLSSNKL